jgi:hypothetical protein
VTIARRLALVVVASLLAGCSAPGGPATVAPTTAAAPSATVQPGEPSIFRPTPDPSQSIGPIVLPAATIEPVVADIARRAGVAPDQVTVLSAESVTFPDGGLGCPVPGMNYIQVLVDGYKIVAQANGITYDYRGTGTTFRLCSQSVS